MSQPTKLYRHFTTSGELLYVGISKCALKRLAQHDGQSSWADAIARIEISAFPTREEALAAERRAICDESPRFNVFCRHNPAPVRNTGKLAALKSYLKERRITQAAFAAELGLKQASISDWLSGATWPSANNLVRISSVTGIPIDVLLGRDAA